MDYDKITEGYSEHLKYQKSLQKFPDGYENNSVTYSSFKSSISEDFDYSIVKMPDGGYVVARSKRLGSLDYDFVCSCASQHEAHDIVKALNK